MVRIYIFLVSLVYLMTQGCHNGSELEFGETLELTGTKIEINEILDAKNLYVYDTLLFIREEPRSKKALKVIDLNDFDIVSQSVYLGRGPGEIVNPGPIVIDSDNNDLWISDWSKLQCFKFPIDSILINEEFKPTVSFDIDIGLMPMLNSFYVSNGYIGFSSYNLRRKAIISFLNLKGELIDSLSIHNNSLSTIWNNVPISDNPYVITYNHTLNKFIIAERHRNSISIIDDTGNLSITIETPTGKSLQQKKELVLKDLLTNYVVFSDVEYIYCLYVGKDFISSGITDGNFEINYPHRLLIYDWNGKGKFDIDLDHELMLVGFDEKRKRIIGISEKYFEGVVMYDLSDLSN